MSEQLRDGYQKAAPTALLPPFSILNDVFKAGMLIKGVICYPSYFFESCCFREKQMHFNQKGSSTHPSSCFCCVQAHFSHLLAVISLSVTLSSCLFPSVCQLASLMVSVFLSGAGCAMVLFLSALSSFSHPATGGVGQIIPSTSPQATRAVLQQRRWCAVPLPSHDPLRTSVIRETTVRSLSVSPPPPWLS